jgi:hypothetical protein
VESLSRLDPRSVLVPPKEQKVRRPRKRVSSKKRCNHLERGVRTINIDDVNARMDGKVVVMLSITNAVERNDKAIGFIRRESWIEEKIPEFAVCMLYELEVVTYQKMKLFAIGIENLQYKRQVKFIGDEGNDNKKKTMGQSSVNKGFLLSMGSTCFTLLFLNFSGGRSRNE